MNEYKGRMESYSREVLRKEAQIKDLQGRIESGDGCKSFKVHLLGSLMFTHKISQWWKNCSAVKDPLYKEKII